MASPSCSQDPSRRQYDVFLSFRGEDVRYGFIGYLHDSLSRKGIDAFIDEELLRGKNLSALLDLIEQSKISIVVFSENYANSDWCLEELSKIMNCNKSSGQEVLPVFYRVLASDVRNQTGNFGAPFERPDESFPEKQDRVPEWKQALKDAAGIAGHVLPDNSPERHFVDKITKETLKMLNKLSPCDQRGLPGMESRARELENLLLFKKTNCVRIVGVVGMAGIGKKTIARCVYHCNYSLFESCYFLEDVRNESKLHCLRQNLLRKLLDDENLDTGAHEALKDRLRNKKVFIVLDDVTTKKQITDLIGEPEKYKETYRKGSRILITSRDHKILKNIVDATYVVPRLNDREALELFSLKAFPDSYLPKELKDLSNKFVDYAKGNPLAIQVLGSDLRQRDDSYWRMKFEGLQTSSDVEIEKMLKASYTDLCPEQKNTFLDIACFFRSEETDFVSSILNEDHYDAASAISDLADKCLLTISSNRLEMHNLLCTMGKKICSISPIKEAENYSRLWNHKDIGRVLKCRIGGIKNIRGIFQDLALLKTMELSRDVFTKMRELKFLKFYNTDCSQGCENEIKLRLKQGLDCLPEELVYLHWQAFPLEYLPSNFNPENLVDLNLRYSLIKQLWEDEKNTEKLMWVDLSHSKDLLNLSGLSEAQNLERLNLEGCTSLAELDPAIQHMNNLVFLNLRDCTSLKGLPERVRLQSLKTLILSGCSNLQEFPVISENIESLYLDGTAIEKVPESVGNLRNLAFLNLKNCNRLKYIDNLGKLKSLEVLNLSGCPNLESFPDIEDDMERLEILLMDKTTIKHAPQNMSFSNLKRFSFCESKVEDSNSSIFLQCSGHAILSDIYLTDCNLHKLPDNFGCLSSLQNVCLSGNYIENLPESIKKLHHLKSLDVKHCRKLKSLPALPSNLLCLDAHGCTSLEIVESPMALLVAQRKRSTFIFTNCFKLTQYAQENILDHGQFKSQLLANASLQYNHKGLGPEPLVEACFPGCDIPSWFLHQTRGSFMETNLPSHWCNSKFFGLSLCVVVSFKDYEERSSRFNVRCRCSFKDTNGDWVSYTLNLRGWNNQCRSPGHETRKLSSDHVFISYTNGIPVQKLHEENNNHNGCCNTEASFEFCVIDDLERKLEGCKVVKCGMSLLYVSDETHSRFRKIKNLDSVITERELGLREYAMDQVGGSNGVGICLQDEEKQKRKRKKDEIIVEIDPFRQQRRIEIGEES